MKPGLLLALLAAVVAGVLGVLQWLATPAIDQQRQAASERRLLDLLPLQRYDNRPLHEPIELPAGVLGRPTPDTGYQARLQGRPSALLLPVSVAGYEGPIRLLVAVDVDGRLIASKVLEQRETPGLADLDAPARRNWLQRFNGLRDRDDWHLRAEGGNLDQMAGATITSRAVRDALHSAVKFHHAEQLTGEQP